MTHPSRSNSSRGITTYARRIAPPAPRANPYNPRDGPLDQFRRRSTARAAGRLAARPRPGSRAERVQVPAVSVGATGVGRQAAGAGLAAQGQLRLFYRMVFFLVCAKCVCV